MATLIESGVLRSDPAFLIRSLIAFWVVGSFAVLTRIGIRWLILRRVIIEETTMFTAFLCWTGSTFVTLKALEYGKKGFAEDSTLELERGAKAYMAAWFLYITAVWSCKASIVLFYMRLSEKIGRTESHHVPAFVVAISYFVCIFVLCFICKPFSNNWSLTPDETQSGRSRSASVWWNTS